MRLVLKIGLPALLVLSACGDRTAEFASRDSAVPEKISPTPKTDALRQIGQQRHGDHIVTLFNETGTVKRGPNRFTLEIRNASTNALVAADQLHVETRMEMPGQRPMVGNASVIPGDVPGRYSIGSDFAARPPVGADESTSRTGRMAGAWALVVTFHPNERVEFTANLQ
jgi:hypothetical protein